MMVAGPTNRPTSSSYSEREVAAVLPARTVVVADAHIDTRRRRALVDSLTQRSSSGTQGRLRKRGLVRDVRDSLSCGRSEMRPHA
jgi:hypothetical protein